MAEHIVPNGIPPQLGGYDEKSQLQFNGLNSSTSSRGSSPSLYSSQIPASQLPPVRTLRKPTGQLPPNHSAVNTVTQKVSQLNVSSNVNPITTSTPNQSINLKTGPIILGQNSAFSPVLPQKVASANQDFQDVPLDNKSSENVTVLQKKDNKKNGNLQNGHQSAIYTSASSHFSTKVHCDDMHKRQEQAGEKVGPQAQQTGSVAFPNQLDLRTDLNTSSVSDIAPNQPSAISSAPKELKDFPNVPQSQPHKAQILHTLGSTQSTSMSPNNTMQSAIHKSDLKNATNYGSQQQPPVFNQQLWNQQQVPDQHHNAFNLQIGMANQEKNQSGSNPNQQGTQNQHQGAHNQQPAVPSQLSGHHSTGLPSNIPNHPPKPVVPTNQSLVTSKGPTQSEANPSYGHPKILNQTVGQPSSVIHQGGSGSQFGGLKPFGQELISSGQIPKQIGTIPKQPSSMANQPNVPKQPLNQAVASNQYSLNQGHNFGPINQPSYSSSQSFAQSRGPSFGQGLKSTAQTSTPLVEPSSALNMATNSQNRPPNLSSQPLNTPNQAANSASTMGRIDQAPLMQTRPPSVSQQPNAAYPGTLQTNQQPGGWRFPSSQPLKQPPIQSTTHTSTQQPNKTFTHSTNNRYNQSPVQFPNQPFVHPSTQHQPKIPIQPYGVNSSNQQHGLNSSNQPTSPSFQNFNLNPVVNTSNMPGYEQVPPHLSTAGPGATQNSRLPQPGSAAPPTSAPSSASMAQLRPTMHSHRYPNAPTTQPPTLQPTQQTSVYDQGYRQQPGVVQEGFNKLWGREHIDLLQTPNILPPTKIQAPLVQLGQESLDEMNCSADIFRSTITKIPESSSLLQKSRLPLGILIHPFKDLTHLSVIQCNVIVRCRACRTYINPFVYFVDSKRWKCNLCYRMNELPDEFQYDPVTKTYGDPTRRPEVKSSTIEYIAPAEYMLRPPQPAVYLFLLDVSRLAVESGYLHTVCNILKEELKNLPGDSRTQIGFVAFNSNLHFYSLAEGLNQPHEMTVLDIDDVFLPCPDNLLVNLKDRAELVIELLNQLPSRFCNSFDNNSALGAALQAAYKMMTATGGRVTVFQAALPNIGPGALLVREDPNQRSSNEIANLNPANDYYKRLALECSGQQIAVDLFILNSQYVDIATISGISRFSGGCIYHFPLFKISRQLQCDSLEKAFRRYLTRKIGFEAVMRIRCTRGLSIHTFHGNFFVRSTDLLSLPNVNPDAGYGIQVSIDETLSDVQQVCFQAALLYTSSKGERRIRVHTLCLPVVSSLHDVINSADEQCIVGLLAKMAVDRSMQSNLSDAREAFINVAIDILSSYKISLNMGSASSGLLAPQCLKLLPLYICALLKHTAFRTGTSTRLDDRVKAMIDMKTKPLYQLMQDIYPDLYPIHNLEEQQVIVSNEDDTIYLPPHLQLSARCLEKNGAYLMDTGDHMMIYVCSGVAPQFLNEGLGVPNFNAITDQMYDLPVLDNLTNQRLHQFIGYLNDDKPFNATIQIIKDNSPNRGVFLERLLEDRVENALSYHEFLQHIKTQVK